MIEIDEVVANKARAHGAEDWLDGLPGLVADLERDWSISVGRSLGGGTEAWVGEAVDERGRAAVLKLCLPRERSRWEGSDRWGEARREAGVLANAGARGCVELYRADIDRGALLLERLGPAMVDEDLPASERLALLAALAADFWHPLAGAGGDAGGGGDVGAGGAAGGGRVVASVPDLTTGSDKAAALGRFVAATWEELGRPCSEAAVEQALAAAERRGRAHDEARAVLVHGDIHQWNALRTVDGLGWKLIDPDGLAAEPEYDLGVILREDPEELVADIESGEPRRRARRLAEYTGTDAEAVWEWGLIERVSTGLLATQIELQPIGREMLEAADLVARSTS